MHEVEMSGRVKLVLMLIHSLFVHLETVLHCSVQSGYSVGMQKFQKFRVIVLYLYRTLVFQHIVVFGKLVSNILMQFLSFWLIHGKLLLMVTNKHFLIARSSTTAVSFNLSLISIEVIASLDLVDLIHGIIQLIYIVSCFTKQFLILFWNKSDVTIVKLQLIQLDLGMGVIYEIFVQFGCLSACIMHRTVM